MPHGVTAHLVQQIGCIICVRSVKSEELIVPPKLDGYTIGAFATVFGSRTLFDI
jgi:hypothetical protein